MITSTDLKNKFYQLWPNLKRQVFWQQGYIFLTGTRFVEPNMDTLERLLYTHKEWFNATQGELTIDLTVPQSRDCNVKATSAHSFIEEWRREFCPKDYQTAIGKTIGSKFQHIKCNHTVLWIYSGRIYLADPAVPKIWEPEKGADEIWLVTSL